MPYILAIIRYRRPLEEVLPYVDAHRTYLKSLLDRGTVLAAGPFNPRTGGALLLRMKEEGQALMVALDQLRDDDPFIKHAVAQYEMLPWEPGMGREALDRL